MGRGQTHDDTDELDWLLASSEALAERSLRVLDWAHDGRRRTPGPERPPLVSIAPARQEASARAPQLEPAPDRSPVSPPGPSADLPVAPGSELLRDAARASETALPCGGELAPVVALPREAELAPVVAGFLASRGLNVVRELCVYPGRRSRRRTVADLVGLRADPGALAQRMRLERRRVTIAEFWPALLETLRLAPAEPFRRQDLLARLADGPLTRDITPGRLTRYLRTLRRYGYLRRVGATTYRKRSDYLAVAEPRSVVAVELKRRSFEAALAQARSYARVVDTVYVATSGTWRSGDALEQEFYALGIGALEVAKGRVREVLPPRPGRGRDPRCDAYGRILEERLVRETVLGRPRAFG